MHQYMPESIGEPEGREKGQLQQDDKTFGWLGA